MLELCNEKKKKKKRFWTNPVLEHKIFMPEPSLTGKASHTGMLVLTVGSTPVATGIWGRAHGTTAAATIALLLSIALRLLRAPRVSRAVAATLSTTAPTLLAHLLSAPALVATSLCVPWTASITTTTSCNKTFPRCLKENKPSQLCNFDESLKWTRAHPCNCIRNKNITVLETGCLEPK